jgi:ATP-dependent Clp protease ATP-binding subunit ClpA
LAARGFDAAFGARPLKRLIQREIADKAAVLILEGKVGEDGAIKVDVDGDQLTVASNGIVTLK